MSSLSVKFILALVVCPKCGAKLKEVCVTYSDPPQIEAKCELCELVCKLEQEGLDSNVINMQVLAPVKEINFKLTLEGKIKDVLS